MKFLGGTRNNRLDFGSDQHSDLDPAILFLLHLFAVCKVVLLYYCSLGVTTTILIILVMSFISILCTSLTLHTPVVKHIPWWRFEHL